MKYRIGFVLGASLLFTLSAQSQTWSPDGSKIAFFYIHSIEDIYLVNPNGSGFEIIDDHKERDFVPVWSPDGKTIVFTSVRDGHHEIYQMTAEGKDVKALTSNSFDSQDGHYSPDGTQLVFSSNKKGGANDIYVMDSDGKNWQQVTDTEEPENTPRWSPNGKRILFLRSPDSDSPSNLFLVNVDGTNEQQVTSNADPEFHPSWSPDGSQFCYIKIVNGVFEIHIYDLNQDTDQTLVSKPGYQAFFPQWSPDGKWIAFTRDISQGTEEGLPALFKVDMEGNEELISNENSFHLYED